VAVATARWLHKFPRVGLMPPVFIASGIDTINVTNVDLTEFGHGYVANARFTFRAKRGAAGPGIGPAAVPGRERVGEEGTGHLTA